MAVVLSWSGGKDGALALRDLQRRGEEVLALLTETRDERTRSHRLRTDLVERQAGALGLPVRFVEFPDDPSNEAYETRMRRVAADLADRADAVAFADIHLESVRRYREDLYAETPLDVRFPLWGTDTEALFEEVRGRYEAIVVCASDDLGSSFAGRTLTERFRAALPPGADPCGEDGEFHTFVTDGPPFREPVPVSVGELFSETGHGQRRHYRDLLSP